MNKIFEWNTIDFKGKSHGQIHVPCPICKKGKTDGALSVNISEGKAICHRCESLSFRDSKSSLVSIEDIKPLPPRPISFFEIDYVSRTLKNYDNNSLAKFLKYNFLENDVDNTINKYRVGTSKQGATVFWQIDYCGKARSGKVMNYDSTGHRTGYTNWVHSILKLNDFNLSQCFFGEHLISTNNKPINIVESEKTAILGNLKLPKYLWLASGGGTGLSDSKCKVLKNRKVTLYPDNDYVYDKWKKRADELGFGISNLVKGNATKGYDLGDWTMDKINTVKKYDATFNMEDYEVCKELILQSKTNEKKDCYDLNGNPIAKSQSDALIRLMML